MAAPSATAAVTHLSISGCACALRRVMWRCAVLDLVVVLVTIVSFALMWAVLRGLERM